MIGVSIVICTYNGVERLPATLESIRLLKTQYPWEVIVVDNASVDNTYAFCKDLLEGSTLSFNLLKFETPGKMYAFWHGVAHSQFDYVLDCDDDNSLAENYIEMGISILSANSRIGALGGCGYPIVSDVLPDWFSAYSKSYAVGPQAKENGALKGDRMGLYGAGCFYKKETLLRLQNLGFQSALTCRKGDTLSSGGDIELCMAIHMLGYEIWYSGDLKFGHVLPSSRLTWEYYLRMKAGTASTFPILHSYFFFDHPHERKFKLFLWKSFWYSIKGYIVSCIKLVFKNDKQTELAYHISKSKIKAFIKNYHLTIVNYQRLSLIFNK
jgi:glycosyltransferase involved in cell wall biosynthesis